MLTCIFQGGDPQDPKRCDLSTRLRLNTCHNLEEDGSQKHSPENINTYRELGYHECKKENFQPCSRPSWLVSFE